METNIRKRTCVCGSIRMGSMWAPSEKRAKCTVESPLPGILAPHHIEKRIVLFRALTNCESTAAT